MLTLSLLVLRYPTPPIIMWTFLPDLFMDLRDPVWSACSHGKRQAMSIWQQSAPCGSSQAAPPGMGRCAKPTALKVAGSKFYQVGCFFFAPPPPPPPKNESFFGFHLHQPRKGCHERKTDPAWSKGKAEKRNTMFGVLF